MKKQFLTLAVCCALVSGTAFASCPIQKQAKDCPPPPPPKCECPCHKKMPPRCPECGIQHAPQAVHEKRQRHIEASMTRERALTYNALCLTDEQKKKAAEIDKETFEGVRPLMQKSFEEKMKVKKLEESKASFTEICKQKNIAAKAKCDVENYMDTRRKAFKCILNSEQKTKYDALVKEKKHDMKIKRNKMKKHQPRKCPDCECVK